MYAEFVIFPCKTKLSELCKLKFQLKYILKRLKKIVLNS